MSLFLKLLLSVFIASLTGAVFCGYNYSRTYYGLKNIKANNVYCFLFNMFAGVVIVLGLFIIYYLIWVVA